MLQKKGDRYRQGGAGVAVGMRIALNNGQRSHSRCTHAQLTLRPSYPSVCAFDGLRENMGSFPSVTHGFVAYEYLQI